MNITIAPSPIHGIGVFARKTIPKNTKIIHYAGETISNAECKKRDKRYSKKGQMWTFMVNNRTSIDANVGGNMARFVNHADHPNCSIQIKGHTIWFRASRKIKPKEELTINYGVCLSCWFKKS